MKKLKWYELLLISQKQKIASFGWKIFIYFNNFTKEEYWKMIYEQEKNIIQENVKNTETQFVTWLMFNCELIQDQEGNNAIWRFEGEDYSLEKLYAIHEKQLS